jgi:aspartate racemase
VARFQARVPGNRYPPILINSIDMTTMLDLVGARQLEALYDYLVPEVERLARAGAAFASNTPHVVLDEIRQRSPIPLVSIVETMADEAAARLPDAGPVRHALHDAGLVLSRRLLPAPRRGIELRVPAADDQAYIHDRYMTELLRGVLQPETRRRLVEIASGLTDREQVEALILGGTELPLILRGVEIPGLPLLDTTLIHVEGILSAMLPE